MRIPLPYQAYKVGVTASTMRLMNCYAEKLLPDARIPYCLKRSPGIDSITDADSAAGAVVSSVGPVRAMHSAFGRLWWVSGTALMMTVKSAAGAYVSTRIGDIGATTFATVDIDNNVDDVVVVNSPLAYKCSSTGTSFAQITDVDFTARGAADVEFLGQYLIFREPNTGRFFCSDLGSSTAYTSTNFATAESSPDALVGIKNDHDQLILFGDTTIEIWELRGGSGFPFQRSSNGIIELGCANGRTIAKLDETSFWLANDMTVRALRGNSPQRVSDYGTEEAITSATIEQAVSWSYTQDGHLFYVLCFPEGTHVYDATEQRWHERGSYGMDGEYIAKTSANAFGLQLIGDASDQDGRIGALNPETHTEFGQTQIMQWTYQPVYSDGNRAFHDRLEIVMRTGVGNIGDSAEPQIMLEVSDDGGEAFELLPTRNIGAIGRRDARPYWTQLGQSDNRVYRASISDAVTATILDTQLLARGARL